MRNILQKEKMQPFKKTYPSVMTNKVLGGRLHTEKIPHQNIVFINNNGNNNIVSQ